MDYTVSSFQYLALVVVAAFVSFYVARFMGWDLSDPISTVAAVALTVAVFSLLIFCLQYFRGRYGSDGTRDSSEG